ncbi:RICIN domain-containing protein [Pedobacter sp. V48]|uniref:RICIN domain-containing protein n=1 Tax=Pedobacter sp. V48 TaxID=509635 RepID=UPI000664569E|nr:RICIN domain-containing protein [Pedobacter sp. V48]
MKKKLTTLRFCSVIALLVTAAFIPGCKRDLPVPKSEAMNSTMARAVDQSVLNADAVIDGYIRGFIVRNNGQAYFAKRLAVERDRTFFWGEAYATFAIEDAYDRTPNQYNASLVSDLVTNLIAVDGTDWKWDTWNDDVQWAVWASIRAYKITGNRAFLDVAAKNWNMVWTRGWDSRFDGGIWELMDDINSGGGKCGLSNWPQIITGALLYEATNDPAYLEKCKQNYAWARTHIWDANTGRVFEGYGPDPSKNFTGDDNQYNYGLMINAAQSLYKITKDPMYYNDAKRSINRILTKINWGILNEDKPANGGFGCDQLVRGIAKFARENNEWGTYYPWLKQNCDAAWNRRRTDFNITGNKFQEQTSTTYNWWAMEVEGSVVIQMVTIPSSNPIVGDHSIVNVLSGKAVDNSSSNANGFGVVQWTKNGGSQQKWRLTQNADYSWYIVSQWSGKALDNPDGTKTNGRQMVQWTFNYGENQKWWIDQQPDGTYKIWNKVSGSSLDNSNSTTDGGKIIQWTWSGQNQQRWRLE